MLLIHPPMAKACEPPAGIARLAGVLLGHELPCTLLDANLEGQLCLLETAPKAVDTWGRRAGKNIAANLAALRDPLTYRKPDRYQRAVADTNRVLEMAAEPYKLSLSLANYQDTALSPQNSADLIRAAASHERNVFYNYFSERLTEIIDQEQPIMIGISLNYLSQALTTFAMLGFLKKHFPHIPLVVGGGLITSWLANPSWENPFSELIDHLVAGPGEKPLLTLLGIDHDAGHHTPDFLDLPLADYLAPGFILPYAASSGCYWGKCSFCPEQAEQNPYQRIPAPQVLTDLDELIAQTRPRLIHFLDNAVSPELLSALADQPPGIDWYGFARVSRQLADHGFCKKLRAAGCIMLKLGLESGDQGVLDAMDKGIDLDLVSRTLVALEGAGIATYVYLLFGTPAESLPEARRTLEFTVRHSSAITFLNLAIFNMPICGPEIKALPRSEFYEGDLSLYTDFIHPRDWDRKAIRHFLEHEFKRHPQIRPILHHDPHIFTSNHAPFFC